MICLDVENGAAQCPQGMGGYSLSGPVYKATLKPEPYAHSIEQPRAGFELNCRSCENLRENMRIGMRGGRCMRGRVNVYLVIKFIVVRFSFFWWERDIRDHTWS